MLQREPFPPPISAWLRREASGNTRSIGYLSGRFGGSVAKDPAGRNPLPGASASALLQMPW